MSPARRSAEATQELRASLIEVAQRIVARDGAAALTMRTLAAEANCAVGLPYKVFGGRGELVAELISAELVNLRAGLHQLVAEAGSGTVGDTLGQFAELLLSSPSIPLAEEIADDEVLTKAVDVMASDTGVVRALETTVAEYLAAEKRSGRIAAGVDEKAFAFLIAGAVHNLLMSGEPYPKHSLADVRRMLVAVAAALSSSDPKEQTDADDE